MPYTHIEFDKNPEFIYLIVNDSTGQVIYII